MSLFIKNGNYIILKDNNHLISDIRYEYGFFMVSNLNNNYEELERNAKLWINIKYLKCKYHPEIMDNIKKLGDKIMVQ